MPSDGARQDLIKSFNTPLAEVVAAINQVKDLKSVLVRARAFENKHSEWMHKTPKEVIDEILETIPDRVQVISWQQAHVAHKPSDFPISELEAYFLWKIQNFDPTVLQITRSEGVIAHREAFSPAESMRCMRDGPRTKKFLLAIADALKKFSHAKTIHMCDAGAGAIPILSIYAALSSEKVCCTALEIDSLSAKIARVAIAAFHLSDQVTLVETDALAYTPKPIDILVSETMDSGLLNEPLTSILDHLFPFVVPGGIVFPSKIEVYAASVLPSYASTSTYTRIADMYVPVIDAEWKLADTYIPGAPLTSIEVVIPGSKTNEERHVLLNTKIYLEDHVLDFYESILSRPVPLLQIVDTIVSKRTFVTEPRSNLRVRYKPGIPVWDVVVDTV